MEIYTNFLPYLGVTLMWQLILKPDTGTWFLEISFVCDISMCACVCPCPQGHYNTVRYKILEGENFGKFGELQAIRQNFLL